MSNLILYKLFVIIILLLPFGLLAQETEINRQDDEEQKIEKIAQETDAELDYADLFQDLTYYKKHPINLNSAKQEQLRALFFLNEVQIANLLDYIKTNGKLISIEELQSVNGYDEKTINMMLPFVIVSDNILGEKLKFKELGKGGDYDFFVRYQRTLQTQKGYLKPFPSAQDTNAYYLGSPDGIFARFRYRFFNRISFGITAEKDPGEQFFMGSQKSGFDFYSAHLFLGNFGIVKSFVVGDYLAQFGQGITFWSGLGFGKSSDAVNTEKVSTPLRPYSSTNENNFLRGSAITLGYHNFELTGFFSRKKVDANLEIQDTLGGYYEYYISSLQTSGLHRSPNEIPKKDAALETVAGGHFAFKNRRLNIGITGAWIGFDRTLQRQIYPYNEFEFNGQDNYNIGIDYSYTISNISVFGEAARCASGGMAFVDGILVCPHPKVSFSLLYRNYQKNYQAIYSSAFSESGNCTNEQGIYTGVQVNLSKKWTLSAYADYFKFPWLRYRVDAPSDGSEYLIEAMYKPSRRTEMYLRYIYENKGLNADDEDALVEYVVNVKKNKIRFNIVFPIGKVITLRNRIEYINYKPENQSATNGYLIYQDIAFKMPEFPLSAVLRYALFDTYDYNTRIYAYENDVLYSYSIPPYYNQGSRFYIMLQYRATKFLDIWLRYAQTIYSDVDKIGTAMDEIDGNLKSEIKAQIRVNF